MKVGILGSGNISCDLMYKVLREPALDLVCMAGIDPESVGLRRAQSLGVATSATGVSGMLDGDVLPELVFDATSARAHLDHAQQLGARGISGIDLTPAAIGPMVIPAVNGTAHLDAPEINLVSCAAQATVPLVAALSRSVGVLRYAETVSTVASKSVGPGTRQNIDEFTHKTRKAVETLGGARIGKTIVVLNPGEPPAPMRNTVYAEVEDVDETTLRAEIASTEEAVRTYVPGYRVHGVTVVGNKVTVFSEVEGAGDFLPTYAGNLDIITAAAVQMARRRAVERASQGVVA